MHVWDVFPMTSGGCGFVKLEKKDKSGSLLFDEKGFFIHIQKKLSTFVPQTTW
jgi:hypothetical protein